MITGSRTDLSLIETTTIDTILPAGGRISGDFACLAGVTAKCLMEMDGSTLLEHAVTSVRTANKAGRIVVIGPEELVGHAATSDAEIVLPEGDTGPSHIRKGMKWLNENRVFKPDQRILILTTALPFIT